MWVYFQGILNSRLCIQGVVCKKRVLPRPLSGYPFFLSMPGQFSLYKLFWFLPFFPFLFPPIYLFWYRCSNATFLLITKFVSDLGCQIHQFTKYQNIENNLDCLHFLSSFDLNIVKWKQKLFFVQFSAMIESTMIKNQTKSKM